MHFVNPQKYLEHYKLQTLLYLLSKHTQFLKDITITMRASSVCVAVLLLKCSVTGGRICPTTINEMKQEAATYESVRYGHYIELSCCSSEGSQVKWVKWNKEAKHWQNYLPDRSEVRFLDNKHILAIQSSTFEDTGLYKCRVQNDSSVTHVKTFQLDVIACDQLARGPYPIAPLPCVETVAKEKNTLTLPCTGYFGCGEDGDIRIVTWYVSLDKDKRDNWVEAASVDTRYQKTDFQQDDGTVIGSNLTIHSVSTTDFNRKFMCVLATPQMVKGQSKLVVTLRKDSPGNSPVFQSGFSSLEVLLVVGAVAVVSLFVNVVVCGVSIYDRSRRKKRARKTNVAQHWTAVTSKDIEDTGEMIDSVD